MPERIPLTSRRQMLPVDKDTLAGTPHRPRKAARASLEQIEDPKAEISFCPGDPQYILQLIAQVITVSLETQRITATLPTLNFG